VRVRKARDIGEFRVWPKADFGRCPNSAPLLGRSGRQRLRYCRRVLERVTERDPHGHQANMAELVGYAAEGKISAHVHATYPLAETPAALRAIAARQVMGKVILHP